MTVGELAKLDGFTALCCEHPERVVSGGYCGDLLSWVMGNAAAGDAWVTIMTNENVIAVASLVDVACAVVCEGCTVPDGMLALAREKGVNLLGCADASFAACARIAALLK